jgi:hypothetical protein
MKGLTTLPLSSQSSELFDPFEMFLRRARRNGDIGDLKRAFLNAECGYKSVALTLKRGGV